MAPLPADVLPGSHFGADLICFILHQHHHQHVTQPLLLEQLRQLGLDVSAGELRRILVDGKDGFHQIGNDRFAFFASTASKSRLNVLEILRRPHADHVVDATAAAYWPRRKLSAAMIDGLLQGPRTFADAAS